MALANGGGRWVLRADNHRGQSVRTIPLTTALAAGSLLMAVIAWQWGQRSERHALLVEFERRQREAILDINAASARDHGALWEAIRSTESRVDSHLDLHAGREGRR